MPRYTIAQLLMATALVAILLGFLQTEGCGARYATIESLAFTSDDSRLLVSKLTARDARTPMKCYKANVARTISFLDVSQGNSLGTIHQDFRRGNCGPAFGLCRIGRASALLNPANDHVVISAFGGGDVIRNVGTESPVAMPFRHSVYNLACSPSGRFLGASGLDEVTVLDALNGTVATRIPASDVGFLRGSRMAFTADETRLVVGDCSELFVWDLATSKRISTVIRGVEPQINAIAVAPDDTLIVCSDDWVRRCDFEGRVVATLADTGAYLCSVSANGNQLAVCARDQVTIYDITSNRLSRSLCISLPTALALSAAGERLAVGDCKGGVALISVDTGKQLWRSNPPGRYRLPWTVPALFLLVWFRFAVRPPKWTFFYRSPRPPARRSP